MTIQEKEKLYREMFYLASNWRSDFIRKEVVLQCQVEREIAELYRDKGLSYIYNATARCRVIKNAYCDVLRERGEL